MKKAQLKEIADIQTGPFGSQLHKEDYVEEGTPIVTVEHLGNKAFSEQNLPKVSSKDRERLKKYVLQKGDIVFSRVGSVDRCSYVDQEHSGWMFSGRCLRVRPFDEIDSEYLYYYFGLEETKQFVRNIAVGATMPSINTKLMGEVIVALPNLEKQKEIAEFLSAIDNKIKVNRKINDNLRLQIKEICTAWLTNFQPFGGQMPSDWIETPLSEIAEFISGYSYKGNELATSTVAMATIKNFDRNGGFKVEGYKEIIPSAKLKGSQRVALFDTLVAHTDLTQNAEVIGNAELVMSKAKYKDIVFSMDLVKVLPKNCGISKFLIAAILQDKRFKAHCLGYVNGTTVLHLSKKALPEYKLYLPSNMDELKPFDNIVTVLYKEIASNISEITQLELLRDSLLPKLMSGEIDVSAVQL